MATTRKTTKVKRDLFEELKEGFSALSANRTSGRRLKRHLVSFEPVRPFKAGEVEKIRKSLKLSRSEFAMYLRTNPRTLENWEQGRAKPNAQATLLLRLMIAYPDTVERVASI